MRTLKGGYKGSTFTVGLILGILALGILSFAKEPEISGKKPLDFFVELVAAAKIPDDATVEKFGRSGSVQTPVKYEILKIKGRFPAWQRDREAGKTDVVNDFLYLSQHLPGSLVESTFGKPVRKTKWVIPFLLSQTGERTTATVFWYDQVGFAVAQGMIWAMLYEPR